MFKKNTLSGGLGVNCEYANSPQTVVRARQYSLVPINQSMTSLQSHSYLEHSTSVKFARSAQLRQCK